MVTWYCIQCLKDVVEEREYFGQELCRECEAKNGTRTPTNEMEVRPSGAESNGVDTRDQRAMVSPPVSEMLDVPNHIDIS